MSLTLKPVTFVVNQLVWGRVASYSWEGSHHRTLSLEV